MTFHSFLKKYQPSPLFTNHLIHRQTEVIVKESKVKAIHISWQI